MAVYKSKYKGKEVDDTLDIVNDHEGYVQYGHIEGSIEDQSDLYTALEGKALKTTTINEYPLSSNIALNAADVNALPNTTKFAKTLTVNNLTITLKDQDGTTLSTQTIPTYNQTEINSKLDLKLNKVNVVGKGSASKPIYFDANGVAQTVTSIDGTITVAKANIADRDGLNNVIAATYKTISSLANKGSATVPVYFDGSSAATAVTGITVPATYDGAGDVITDTYKPLGTTTINNTVDWDTLTTAGDYKVQCGTGWGAQKHNPDANCYNGLLIVERLKASTDSGNRIVQTYYPNTDSEANGSIWVRSCNSGTWDNWRRIDSRGANDLRYVRRLSTSAATGSTSQGTYVNADGQITACTATVGSSTRPIYLNNGVATTIGYTIEKSVPSNAVFTDTNTEVTQKVTSTNASYPILLCPTAGAITDQGEKEAIFASANDVNINPYDKTLTVSNLRVTGQVVGDFSVAQTIEGVIEKAEKDALGNVIDTTYVKVAADQTITGPKNFQGGTTESFGKALKVSSLESGSHVGINFEGTASNNPKHLGYLGVSINERPIFAHQDSVSSTSVYRLTRLPAGQTTAVGSSTNPVYVTGDGIITACGNSLAVSITGNANTATTLQTTRSINGTNFNGSANITTTNWGTGRNISISDSDGTNTGTAVLVNGSQAYTLKLPDTIKANITGNLTGTAARATADANGNNIANTYATKAQVASAYVASGSVTFANLPALNSSNLGKVYNVTDAFTTNSNFVEGAGKSYPAGTNVVIVNTEGTTYKYDALAGWVDLSGYSTIANTVSAVVAGTTANKINVTKNGSTSTITVNNVANATTATTCTGNAASATKLETGRSINGTSFNGTSAITTANWGTARNIGIVNSDGTGTAVTVSVNGSGNVNLKLPASIKADITGNLTGNADTATTAAACTGNSATATTAAACTGNAATATTLKTTRTINGTNFNGSANITTASWGKARNISIADSDSTNTGAAISVDGSGAATLKLPASIKANITGNLTGNASTATTLQTGRSINGTSFNGSTAITTANWGTARDITISDSDGTNTGAAVSVNGSANKTLKLPATIKANITGNLTGNATTATTASACSGNAATATTASKLGTSTVGGVSVPIYLNSGTATVCNTQQIVCVISKSDSSIAPRWWRLWSDGWLEQGGYITDVPTSYTDVELLKSYKDMNYSLSISQVNYSGTDGAFRNLAVGNKGVSAFQIISSGAGSSCSWRAEGYAG